jgi:AcrR family transcriptional regulator
MARAAPALRARYPHADATRRRLVEAAVHVFAEHGFRRGTTREICRRARANSAMANYHFGSKASLYRAAVRAAVERVQRDAPLSTSAPPPRGVEEGRARLRECVAVFASGLLARQLAVHRRLLLREMGEPTGALADLVDELIRPRFDALRAAVRALAPDVDDRDATWAALCVLGQISYHRTAGPVALRLLGERAYGPALVAEVVERVSTFSERALGVGAEGGHDDLNGGAA